MEQEDASLLSKWYKTCLGCAMRVAAVHGDHHSPLCGLVRHTKVGIQGVRGPPDIATALYPHMWSLLAQSLLEQTHSVVPCLSRCFQERAEDEAGGWCIAVQWSSGECWISKTA